MNNRLNRFCLVISFGLPFAVYIYTAAPGPFWQDSSLFSMAAATLSIPHSPGFPLWVLIGKLFTWLIPQNPARATNLMCGLFGALAVALFYLCVNKILFNFSAVGQLSQTGLDTNPSPLYGEGNKRGEVFLTSLGAALVFAFSQTVWLQSVRAEVYSLQLAVTLIVFWLALTLAESRSPARTFILGAFLWGLSADIHPLLAVSTLPGFLVLGWFASANWKSGPSKWGWAFGLVLLAGTIYLFLPIRSYQNPYLNWNQPDNWERFWAAISRSSSWKVSLASTPLNLGYANVMRFVSFLLSEYSVFFWVFALAGLIAILRLDIRRGIGISVLLFSNVFVTLWAAEFSRWNMDLFGYLSFGTGLAVLTAASGIFQLSSLAWRRLGRFRYSRWAAPVIAGLFAFILVEKNWTRADLHTCHWPQKIAQESLQSLPSHAAVFYSSDRLLTPVWYQQGALGQRPDVAIVLANAFTSRLLWEQTRRRYPDLVLDSSFIGTTLEQSMGKTFLAFCRQNKRPVFCQLGKQLTDCSHLWPAGYILQYRPERVGSGVGRQVVDFVRQTFVGEADFLTRENLGLEIYNWGAYLAKIGAPEAETLITCSAEFDSTNPSAWFALGRGYYRSKRFVMAEECFQRAVFYDPYMGESYLYLARCLEKQGKPEDAEKMLAEAERLVPDEPKSQGGQVK